jgi:predicted enzyme related to lactoylglutathione lyase
MDYEKVPAEEFGRSLGGLGVNLLSPDVPRLVAFLGGTFGLATHRVSPDFAIVVHTGAIFQIHADATFGAHPVHGLLPDTPPRGSGVQLYLFGIDPDAAVARAAEAGGIVIEPPRDKPHGLREATILSPEGYAFSPAVPTV